MNQCGKGMQTKEALGQRLEESHVINPYQLGVDGLDCYIKHSNDRVV